MACRVRARTFRVRGNTRAAEGRRKTTQMGGGFGTGSSSGRRQKVPQGFESVGSMSILDGRDTKAVKVGSLTLMLFNVDGKVYCTDALSTAYKFPLSDAKVNAGESGPEIEVPLDGTRYDLTTGKVLEWCPKNNPLRSLLGRLKDKEKPVPLKVYEVCVVKDTIYCNIQAE